MMMDFQRDPLRNNLTLRGKQGLIICPLFHLPLAKQQQWLYTGQRAPCSFKQARNLVLWVGKSILYLQDPEQYLYLAGRSCTAVCAKNTKLMAALSHIACIMTDC